MFFYILDLEVHYLAHSDCQIVNLLSLACPLSSIGGTSIIKSSSVVLCQCDIGSVILSL